MSQVQKRLIICLHFISAVATECYEKGGVEAALEKSKEKAGARESGGGEE